jgi:hypothetical protein
MNDNELEIDYKEVHGVLIMDHVTQNYGHSVTVLTDNRAGPSGEDQRMLIVSCNGTPENFMQLGTQRDCDFYQEWLLP